jgi:O-antigen ligase
MAILSIWTTIFLLLAIMGGGIVVWSVCLAAIVAWSAWALIPAPDPAAPSRALKAAALALGAAVALVALTMVPLPATLAGLAGEPRATQNRDVADAVSAAGQAGLAAVGSTFFALTRNVAGTGRMLALLLAAVSMALLAARLDEAGRRRLMAFMSLAGAAVAVLGYVGQHVRPQGDTLLWWLPIRHALPGPVACFGNRNHYAGFLALVSVCSFAMCLQGARERKFGGLLIHGPAFLVMAAALVLAMSRGAVLAWAAGLATVSIFGIARRLRLTLLLCALAATVAFCAAVSLPSSRAPDRYKSLVNPLETSSAVTRLNAWRDSLHIWAAYPVIGAGANAYRTVFPQYRRTTEGAFATYPENLYVQILAETGLAGAFSFLVLVVAGARIALRRWRSDSADRSSVTAGIGAAAVALAHGMVDMPLQVPLYAVTAGSVAALLVIPAPPADAPRSYPAMRVPLAVAAIAAAAGLALDSGRLRTMDAPLHLEYAGQRDVQRALAWAPSSWHAWYYLGRHTFMLRTPEGTKLGAHCLSMAGACDPNNYRLWLEIGNARRATGDIEGARAAYKRVREIRHWVPVPQLPEAPQ